MASQILSRRLLFYEMVTKSSVPSLLALPANGEQSVEFSLEPDKAGARNLKVTVESPLQDTNASTDTDYAVFMVEAPELFRVLYLSIV